MAISCKTGIRRLETMYVKVVLVWKNYQNTH